MFDGEVVVHCGRGGGKVRFCCGVVQVSLGWGFGREMERVWFGDDFLTVGGVVRNGEEKVY